MKKILGNILEIAPWIPIIGIPLAFVAISTGHNEKHNWLDRTIPFTLTAIIQGTSLALVFFG